MQKSSVALSSLCSVLYIDVKRGSFAEIPQPSAKARQANNLRGINGKERIEKLNISNLIHSFQYRDISKEAVMSILEVMIEK